MTLLREILGWVLFSAIAVSALVGLVYFVDVMGVGK